MSAKGNSQSEVYLNIDSIIRCVLLVYDFEMCEIIRGLTIKSDLLTLSGLHTTDQEE